MKTIRPMCLAMLILASCASPPPARPVRSQAELLAAREANDRRFTERLHALIDRNLRRIKADHDDYVAGRRATPPVVNFLVLSGGGDWGAFGAGFLVGWGKVSPGPMARPMFDTVTGVSTGALIAPFAFLGDDQSIEAIENVYRNPPADLMEPQGIWNLLTGGASYAKTPGLERVMRGALTMERVKRIADIGASGRLLAVNTTNIDTGEMYVWDLVAEAQLADKANNDDRFQDVLMASAAIPGIFPPRLIDGQLYVDGGVTGNVLFTGRAAAKDDDSFIGRWQAAYPNVPIPKTRYWVILNNQIRALPEVVAPKWSSVLLRSSSAAIRAASLNSIRQIFLRAQIAKLKYGADVEVRLTAMPDGWTAPNPAAFDKDSMNALADLGRRMGADPASWQTEPP